MVVPQHLMWCIWWERNNRHFENSGKTVPNLKLFFFETLLDWVAMLGFCFFFFFSVHGLKDSLFLDR